VTQEAEKATCTDHWAEPLRTGGDVHRCVLPAVHVFDEGKDQYGMPNHLHRCDCSAAWCDIQQIDEAWRQQLAT
jgi:hypothetical protein